MRQTDDWLKCQISALPKIASLLLVFMSISACTDNATKLSNAIEHAAGSPPAGAGIEAGRVLYSPKTDPELPYYLVFFPEHRVSQERVEAAGLPPVLASRIYRDMAYLSVGDAPFLVVVQAGGGLNFTTRWHLFASVPEVLVVPGQGTVELVLTRDGERIIVGLAGGG